MIFAIFHVSATSFDQFDEMKTVYILILSAIAVHGYRLSFLNKKYFTFSYGIQNSSSVVTELSTDRNLIVTTVGYFEPEACAGSTVQPNVTTNWLRRSGAGFASNLSWLYQKGYNGTVNGLNTTLQAANRVVNGLSVRDWLESIKARYYENLVFNMTDPINENEALSEDGRKETIKMRLQTMYSTMIECAHPCGQSECVKKT